MQVSSVNLTDLNPEFRIDAEYYRAEILSRLNILEHKKNDTLDNLVDFVVGPFGSTVTVDKYVEKSNYRYIRNRDINDFRVKDDEPALIPQKVWSSLPQFHLQENDLLITVVGTLGKVAIATVKDNKSIFSCKSTILRATHINPFYLLAYLNSDTGKLFSLRGKRGAIQEGLNLSDLKEIQVFVPSDTFQVTIEKAIRESFTKVERSEAKYKQAQTILLLELGLTNWQPQHQLTFVKNYSDTEQAGRIDAEYYQPKYEEIISKIKKFKTLELSDDEHFKIITGTYTKEYSSEGNYYIRSVDISNDLTIDAIGMYRTNQNLESKCKVKTGDIVTSRVGSIGTLGYITKELNDSYISDNIIRIRNCHKDIDSLFLAFFLKQIGSILMERLSRGSVQQRLNQETIKEIKIPLMSVAIQQKIINKIIESHRLKKKSKYLLECSKRAVEMAIEQDEQKAINWLKEQTHDIGIMDAD